MSVLRFTLGLTVTDRVYEMDVHNFVPAVDNLLATDEPGQFDVDGGSDVTDLVIVASYGNTREVVGRGSKTAGVVTFTFSELYDGVDNTMTPYTNGATFTVLRDGNWPTDQVDFAVYATTSDGFELSEEWSWLTTPSTSGFGDVSPTLAVTILPGEGAPEETNIVIDIVDLVRGVDMDTINIQVGGSPAFVSNAFQAGFAGPESAIIGIAGGFRVTIDREADYTPGETVSVSVTAKAPA